MKKIVVGVTLLVSVLFLSGCNMFDEGINNIWYDDMNETIHLSYDLGRPEKDDNDESIPEFYYLLAKNTDTGEWYDVIELDNYRADELEIDYHFDHFGDIELKIEKRDAYDSVTDESDIFNIYINSPEYIYHFDTYFDSWSGGVQFNYGLNFVKVKSIAIYKSIDGGMNWEEIISQDVVESDDNMADKNSQVYYEYTEGKYVYKIVAFDDNQNEIQVMNSWGEINVSYQDKVFEGTPNVDYIGSSFNIYDRSVNIWWNANGAFDTFVIEKSTDDDVWEFVGEVPRFAQTFRYTENIDGDYLYRVKAMELTTSVSDSVTEELLRVKEGILIGHFDGWIQWDTQTIELNWEFMSEDALSVVVERKIDAGEFEVVGEFGGLKKMFSDSELDPGSYTYLISIINDNGTVLDSLESNTLVIERPQHVYHLNAWFNQSTGEIQLNFGVNQDHVSSYIIEKSIDGGLTWEVYIEEDLEFIENNWYKDTTRAYELTEGVYAYRILGYNNSDKLVGEAYTYNEVIVEYNDLNLDEPTEIYHLDGNFNIYDNSINLWWNGQGNFSKYVLEVSNDGENWDTLKDLPRVATSTQVNNLDDGEYYFRINAVDSNDETIYSKVTESKIRIKENAQIGSFNVYSNWEDNQLNLHWDIIKDQVSIIKIERRLDNETTYTLIGEYGPLKTALMDNLSESGTYIYKLTLSDNDSNIIDELESNECNFEVSSIE